MKKTVDQQESLLAQGIEPVGNWNDERSDFWGILHTEQDGEVIRKSYPTVPSSYQALYDNLYATIHQAQAQMVKMAEVILVLEIIEKAFESAKKDSKARI